MGLDSDCFSYKGKLDNSECNFKIDTGSNISFLNKKLVQVDKQRIRTKKDTIRYPSGDEVPIEFKVKVTVVLGKFTKKIPMYVLKMSEDCLLGVDFLKEAGLKNVFKEAFGFSEFKEKQNLNCSRVQSFFEKVPSILKELYAKDSVVLNKSQRDVFANLLCEYRDIFFERIVTGNCDILTHTINLKDSSPIKQVPRRIPIRIRGKVDKIVKEMKAQGVIEGPQSPNFSRCFSKKKGWNDKILRGFSET